MDDWAIGTRHHCDECRFTTWSVHIDDGECVMLKCDWACPMPHACATCDEIESSREGTRVMPRLVVT